MRPPGERPGAAPRGDVVADGPVAGRLQAGEAIEVVALGAVELQGAGEGGDDLRRRGGRPALLEAHHVVDREAGEVVEPLATQARRPPGPPGAQADVRRPEPVPPQPDGRAEAGRGGRHDPSVALGQAPGAGEGGTAGPTVDPGLVARPPGAMLGK